jgi:hypothetical protein
MKPDHTPSKDHHKSQHQVLQGYSSKTAFYVAPIFTTYTELGKKQTIGSEELPIASSSVCDGANNDTCR